jgi:hypothetical protein
MSESSSTLGWRKAETARQLEKVAEQLATRLGFQERTWHLP